MLARQVLMRHLVNPNLISTTTLAVHPDQTDLYRIRRIKCDEAKPSCQRCTSTGRKCDGYTSALTNLSFPVEHQPPRFLLNPSLGLDMNSVEEQQAFHFFKYQTAFEVSS